MHFLIHIIVYLFTSSSREEAKKPPPRPLPEDSKAAARWRTLRGEFGAASLRVVLAGILSGVLAITALVSYLEDRAAFSFAGQGESLLTILSATGALGLSFYAAGTLALRRGRDSRWAVVGLLALPGVLGLQAGLGRRCRTCDTVGAAALEHCDGCGDPV